MKFRGDNKFQEKKVCILQSATRDKQKFKVLPLYLTMQKPILEGLLAEALVLVHQCLAPGKHLLLC